MSASFKFGTETFRPLCLPGNSKAEERGEKPTEFDLVAVGGASRARLKSLLIATSGLAATGNWTPEVQDAVIRAFETGPAVFAEGVTRIRELTAPAALCLKVGLLRELPAGLHPDSQVPITTGFEFAQIAGHWPILAYEIALAIARISDQADIDPRFFDWLSTSLGLPGTALGTVGRVESGRKRSGTAGKSTRTASGSTRGTSRRSASSRSGTAARTGAR